MQKLLTGIIIVIVALAAYNFFLKPPSFTNGTVAPSIEAQLISGEDFSLSDLRGQYVLLDFWGSWCGPCIKDIPKLRSLYNKYENKVSGNGESFEIVSIALEKSDKYTKRIIEQKEMTWPYHIIDVSRIVMMSSIAQAYDVKDLPTTFLLNPNGEIIGTNLTYEETTKILDARLN